MKRTSYLIITILIIICIFLTIQLFVNYKVYQNEKIHFVTSLCIAANASSENIEFVLNCTEDIFDESMIGIRIYLDVLSNIFRIEPVFLSHNILFHKYNFLEELNRSGYMTMTYVQDEYEIIFKKHRNGNKLDDEDFEYLRKLKTELNKLCDSMQNEDGSLKSKAINKTYFADYFNNFIKSMYM